MLRRVVKNVQSRQTPLEVDKMTSNQEEVGRKLVGFATYEIDFIAVGGIGSGYSYFSFEEKMSRKPINLNPVLYRFHFNSLSVNAIFYPARTFYNVYN